MAYYGIIVSWLIRFTYNQIESKIKQVDIAIGELEKKKSEVGSKRW